MIKVKNLFSIGEISKIKEITIKALRYYHKVGILIPRYIDEKSGYRYYSIDQFIYIDIIKGCRALGTSIAELQEIFKECNTDKLIEFLQLKRIEAKKNISKMEEIIKNIDRLNMEVEQSKNILNNDEMEISFFKKRYIIVVPCKEVGSLKELIYYSDLEKVIHERDIDVSMERGIIYNIEFNGNVKPAYVFNTIKEDIKSKDDNYIKVLPEGRYLTLAYSKANEEIQREKLFNYIDKNKLKIRSFIEIDLFNDFFNIESYSCQIQVFIEDDELIK